MPVYCRYCGTQLSDTAAFCRKCGKPTGRMAKTQAEPAGPVPAPQPEKKEKPSKSKSGGFGLTVLLVLIDIALAAWILISYLSA